jgi:hypothetical protein
MKQSINYETINKLFDSITPEITKEISEKEDFDFHTGSIAWIERICKNSSNYYWWRAEKTS